MAIEAETTLLHYRLIEQIGEGGMGQVWLELVETGHLPDLEVRTPIINRWLDETLGPIIP